MESEKTLGLVASQAMHIFRPIVQAVVISPVAWDRLAKLLERRGAIEVLVRRLEKQTP